MNARATTSANRSLQELIQGRIPDQGEWTVEDYLWLTEGSRHLVEFTEGRIEVLPMPTDKHQAVLQFLLFVLAPWIQSRGGTVRVAPLPLKIGPVKVREPDLLVLRSAADPRRQMKFWTGADLVIEIVSPSDPARDRVQKRRDYAQAGIPEYWIVDPQKEEILVLELAGKKYRQAGKYRRGKRAISATLDGFTVEVNEVLDAK